MSEQQPFNKVVMGRFGESKINAMNVFSDYLIIGDDKGTVYSFEITRRNVTKMITSQTLVKGKPIEQIITLPNQNVCLVVCQGTVNSLMLPNLSKCNALEKEGIERIYLNKYSKEHENKVLAVNKKKKIKIFNYDPLTHSLSEEKREKDIPVSEIPPVECGQWVDNYFVYGSKKVTWLNLKTGDSSTEDYGQPKQIINLIDKVAVVSDALTLFMKNGKIDSFSPLSHQFGVPVSQGEYEGYFISLFQNFIIVWSREEEKYNLVGKINFENSDGEGKYIICTKSRIVLATSTSTAPNSNEWGILGLIEKPYTEQMESLIKRGEYDTALEKLIKGVPETDDTKQQKVEGFFLDCAWACLDPRKSDFNLALKYINLTNFNPFEFIYMFYDALSVNIIHSDKYKAIQDSRDKTQITSLYSNEEDIKKIYSFLVNILIAKRDYILNTYKFPNDDLKNITFLSSKYSIINLSGSTTDISIQKTLNSINSTLIKAMIKMKKQPKDIESVIDNKSINYSIFDEFKDDIFFADENNKKLNETKFTLAYMAEKRGDYEEALKVWKFFGYENKDDPTDKGGLYAYEGRDRTKKIFDRFKDTKSTDRLRKESLFRDYIQWLLIKYPNEAFEVAIKTEMVGIKVFMDEIIPKVEASPDYKNDPGKLKELFLEYFNQTQQTENYQTQLLELYAEKMFSYVKKDEPKINIGLEGELKKYHDLFMKIIKDPNSCYNKKAILDYIEKSWLNDARIYLYSQLKEHDKALNELFTLAKVNMNFSQIEKYCEENIKTKPDIFENFYKLLSVEIRNNLQGQIDESKNEIEELKKKRLEDKHITETDKKEYQEKIDGLNDAIKRFEELKKPYEVEMLRILKEYGNINNLDPEFALTYANDHWNICDNGEFYNYLLNVVRDYTTQGNKYKLGRNLSEMGLIYKEKEALDYKKKYVIIESEKICDLCKNKISNAIFVVYPNLKVYHVKCARNLNIDPMTGVDFSKKKFI